MNRTMALAKPRQNPAIIHRTLLIETNFQFYRKLPRPAHKARVQHITKAAKAYNLSEVAAGVSGPISLRACSRWFSYVLLKLNYSYPLSSERIRSAFLVAHKIPHSEPLRSWRHFQKVYALGANVTALNPRTPVRSLDWLLHVEVFDIGCSHRFISAAKFNACVKSSVWESGK